MKILHPGYQRIRMYALWPVNKRLPPPWPSDRRPEDLNHDDPSILLNAKVC